MCDTETRGQAGRRPCFSETDDDPDVFGSFDILILIVILHNYDIYNYKFCLNMLKKSFFNKSLAKLKNKG